MTRPHVRLTASNGQPVYTVACTACEGVGQHEPLCLTCNGSGEGMVDGSRCLACKGGGSFGPFDCEVCMGEGEAGATLLDLALHMMEEGLAMDQARDFVHEAMKLQAGCEKCMGKSQLAQERHARLDAEAATCERVAAGGAR